MRVLVVDDHRLMSDAISNLLAAHEIEVLGVAGDGLEAIQRAQELHPDVILMDIRMPRCDGLSATRQIKALCPEIKILMLTTSAEDQDLFESIKSGASGYLLKSISGNAFIEALRGLEQGTPPFSPGLASRLLREFAKLSSTEERFSGAVDHPNDREEQTNELTERQTEVLRLVAQGFTYREVGKQLSVSERTVRFHMTEIISRLHLQNRSQVLAYAGKLGLKSDD
jgi:two-component system NarL family response regulator